MSTRAQNLLALAFVLPFAYAEANETLAVCTASYSWANNALGKSPCDVATLLARAPDCLDDPDFATTALRNAQDWYDASWGEGRPFPPQCMCTGVMYVLSAACGDCQYTGAYRSWTTYMKPCNTTPAEGYPFAVPTDTEIPQWVFGVNFTDDVYDPISAQEVARIGASPGSSSSSVAMAMSSTSSFASNSNALTSSSSPAASDPATPLPPSGSSTPVAAIAGGAIGGAIILGVLAALIFCLRRRERTVIDVDGDKEEPQPSYVAPYMIPPENDLGVTSPARNRDNPLSPIVPAHRTSSAASPTSAVATSSNKTRALLTPSAKAVSSAAAIRAVNYAAAEPEPEAALPVVSTASYTAVQAAQEAELELPPPAYAPSAASSSTSGMPLTREPRA